MLVDLHLNSVNKYEIKHICNKFLINNLFCNTVYHCSDLELVFNAIIALVMVQPFHVGEALITSLCDKLHAQSGDKRNILRLRL